MAQKEQTPEPEPQRAIVIHNGREYVQVTSPPRKGCRMHIVSLFPVEQTPEEKERCVRALMRLLEMGGKNKDAQEPIAEGGLEQSAGGNVESG